MPRSRHTVWRRGAYTSPATVALGKARARFAFISAAGSLSCLLVIIVLVGVARGHLYPWVVLTVSPMFLIAATLGALARSPELVVKPPKSRGQHREVTRRQDRSDLPSR